jgi:AcrR family transcriptional regulator
MPVAPRQLTRDRIAATALELLDRDGLDAFSMRRLADELGVGTMSIYTYFRGKEELLDAVMDSAGTDVAVAAFEGTWRERLIRGAQAVRDNLERHPALVEIRLRRPLLRPRQFNVTEQAVSSLIDAGLPPAEAARAFRVIFTHIFGFVAFSPTSKADDTRRELRVALASLAPDEYPTIASMVDHAVDAATGDDQFEYGLELILDGIEARMQHGTLDGDGQGQAQSGGG